MPGWVILIYSHKQGHSSRSEILPPTWNIFKSKMKESKVQSVGELWWSDLAEKKLRIFEVILHIKMQSFWLSSMLGESFSFLQDFEISFELRFWRQSEENAKKSKKIAEITLTVNKIVYFAQFGMFGNILVF